MPPVRRRRCSAAAQRRDSENSEKVLARLFSPLTRPLFVFGLAPTANDDAEGEIDPWRIQSSKLGQLMHPIILQPFFHKKKAAIGERKSVFLGGFPVFVFELKLSWRTKTHRGYDRRRAQFRLVIGMPGYTVLT